MAEFAFAYALVTVFAFFDTHSDLVEVLSLLQNACLHRIQAGHNLLCSLVLGVRLGMLPNLISQLHFGVVVTHGNLVASTRS